MKSVHIMYTSLTLEYEKLMQNLFGSCTEELEAIFSEDHDDMNSEVTACEVFEMKSLKQKKKW